ncbi:contact-dependent growth inhibition system immunity protein [Corallococcus exiguus]|uniref:contact-dependent growth inhibition system immunity protein n=1 Tax=Corallococcus exiguus TaxID=83462 RepID=UPI001494D78C|nr:contact-dependent growth inhibition system immunity protein [Corallococcus exiguus]NPD27100.1 hypothetical protein [Corallococcus exiguus]
MNTPYPTLRHFFLQRFHQDAELNWPDMKENVREWATWSETGDLEQLVDDLRRFVAAQPDDAALEAALLDELACAFHPPGMGMSYREWLAYLDDTFSEELRARRAPPPPSS